MSNWFESLDGFEGGEMPDLFIPSEEPAPAPNKLYVVYDKVHEVELGPDDLWQFSKDAMRHRPEDSGNREQISDPNQLSITTDLI